MTVSTEVIEHPENTEPGERFFVLTGGPGSGKSTILDALERTGYARSIEAGRGVIQDQVAIGGESLPWRNPGAFAELMLSWEMRSYQMAKQQTGPVFFDRGVPDVVGYLRLLKRTVPPYMDKAAQVFRYHRRVLSPHPGSRFSSNSYSAGTLGQSSGSSSVVTDRSASVMTQIFSVSVIGCAHQAKPALEAQFVFALVILAEIAPITAKMPREEFER